MSLIDVWLLVLVVLVVAILLGRFVPEFSTFPRKAMPTARLKPAKKSAAAVMAKDQTRSVRLRNATVSNLERAVPFAVKPGERIPSLMEFASDAVDAKAIPILRANGLVPA